MSSHPTIESPKDAPSEVADPSSRRFHPRQIFWGRYRIVAQLGRGGMDLVDNEPDWLVGAGLAVRLP